MAELPDFLSCDAWMLHLFSSRAAREGGVIRRKTRDIDRFVGREHFCTKCGGAVIRWSRMPGNS